MLSRALSLLVVIFMACGAGPPGPAGQADASSPGDAAPPSGDAAPPSGEDAGPGDAPPHDDAAAPLDPCATDPDPREPPIDGELLVRVHDGVTGAPLAGATVTFVGATFTATRATDERGCTLLRGPDVRAPITLHVSAPDHEITSREGFDRARQLLYLAPRDYSAPGRSPGVFRGVITNLDVIGTSTDATHARYATVSQILADQTALPLSQPTRPEARGYGSHTVVEGAGLDLRTYALRASPTLGRGLLVLGGTHTPPPNAGGAFTPTWIGLAPTASVAWGGERTLDLTLTHRLDRRIRFELRNAPPLGIAGVRMQIHVPGTGFINLGGVFNAPWPYDALGPAATGVFADSYPAGAALTYDADQSHRSDRWTPGAPGQTTVVIDDWLVPADALRVEDGRVRWSGLVGHVSYCQLIVYDRATRLSHWRAMVLAPTAEGVALPPNAGAPLVSGHSLDASLYCSRAPGWDGRDFAQVGALLDASAETHGRVTF